MTITFYAFTDCDDIKGTRTRYGSLETAFEAAKQHALGGVLIDVKFDDKPDVSAKFLTTVYGRDPIDRIKKDALLVLGVEV